MATFKISGAAPALLLAAALLAAGASADHVTVEPCWGQAGHSGHRVRQYPEDSSATHLWIGCVLTELVPADLENLPQVQYILVYSNGIDHINTSALRTVPALKELWLENNKFRELPVFVEGSCSNLTVLNLSKNMLTAVGAERTFSACRKLEMLLLNKNQIQYLHPEAFNSLPELTHLSLEDNRISFLPNTIFVRNRQLKVLHLHNNRLTHLPPDFASSHKRAGTSFEEFYFFGNPWDCACLLELIADVKRVGVGGYDNWQHHYDGTAPVCAYCGAAPCSRRAPGLLRPAGGGAS